MIKDKYTLAIIATLFANTIKNIIDYSFYTLDITEHCICHIAASTYFAIADTKTIPALIIGVFSDYGVAMILGLTIVLLLSYTGTAYFWLKGLSVGLFSWLLIYGIILRMEVGRIEPLDPATNLINLAEHLLLGGLISYFIMRYGRNYLSND